MIAILAVAFDVAALDAACNLAGVVLGISLVSLLGARALIQAGGGGVLPTMRKLDRIAIPLALAFLFVSGLRIVLALAYS